MKREFSAGGIVFKKIDEKLMILVCQHSAHHGWVFPKGFIGDKIQGETKEATAIREVEEETGVQAEILQKLNPITYWYVMSPKGTSSSEAADTEKHQKTVYYYIMKATGGDITKHDFEMEKVEWLSEEEVENRLTYDSDKKVWTEAKGLIDKLIFQS